MTLNVLLILINILTIILCIILEHKGVVSIYDMEDFCSTIFGLIFIVSIASFVINSLYWIVRNIDKVVI
jgi:hypothetical protein